MIAQRLCLDMISTLPQPIIETILCLLPIQDAARTSILSKEWRYKWIKIPKLVFDCYTYEFSNNENQQSILDQTLENQRNERTKMSKRCKLFYAIYQVLLQHQGPILDFKLVVGADDTCFEIDQIISHLSRNGALKKLTLYLGFEYRLPLSVFSLHQLTDLLLYECVICLQPTFNGFGSLTSLHLDNVNISKKTLLHLVSNCPLLKSFGLLIDKHNILGNDDSTIIELFECLPVIEHLTIWAYIIQCYVQDAVPRQLPTSLVHLKYLCLDDVCFVDKYGLPFLVLLIRSSPKLEKIKIFPECDECYESSEIESVTLKNYSDIWLEHLNELEIVHFGNLKPELEFVKLILAKSPVLKKVKIILHELVDKDEELQILRILLRSPHASPVAKIIVQR